MSNHRRFIVESLLKAHTTHTHIHEAGKDLARLCPKKDHIEHSKFTTIIVNCTSAQGLAVSVLLKNPPVSEIVNNYLTLDTAGVIVPVHQNVIIVTRYASTHFNEGVVVFIMLCVCFCSLVHDTNTTTT